ncbi:hypothetical protein HMPREF0346_1478, partial [Enterococcus faecalis EnGen0297]
GNRLTINIIQANILFIVFLLSKSSNIESIIPQMPIISMGIRLENNTPSQSVKITIFTNIPINIPIIFIKSIFFIRYFSFIKSEVLILK